MTSNLQARDATIDSRMGLTYATHDGTALLGDLFLPQGSGPFPVLVAVHGGGWQQGARNSFHNWGPYLAARGYALFTVSYRLAKKGQGTFPQAAQDVRAAVQFMRGSAAEFKLDPERIALMGASAGGHLAALAALAGDSDLLAGGYPQDAHAAVASRVKALIGVYGVFDLMQMWEQYQRMSPTENNIEKHLGVPPMENRRLYFEASPVNHATFANNKIAVFLACGTEDDVVDRAAQTDAFLLALKRANFFARTCIIPGAGHYFMSDPIDEAGSYTGFLAPRLMRFLAEKL
jgi:acetyl esterase/lipase